MDIPKHQKELSIIYWRMVKILKKNGFNGEMAGEIITIFFQNFNPTPTLELKRD